MKIGELTPIDTSTNLSLFWAIYITMTIYPLSNSKLGYIRLHLLHSIIKKINLIKDAELQHYFISLAVQVYTVAVCYTSMSIM